MAVVVSTDDACINTGSDADAGRCDVVVDVDAASCRLESDAGRSCGEYMTRGSGCAAEWAVSVLSDVGEMEAEKDGEVE